LKQDQIVELCLRVNAAVAEGETVSWPPILGLFKAVVVTLTYLRRNRVQAEIAESFGVSQPTISRAVTALTPVPGRVLADAVPVAEDLDPRTQYVPWSTRPVRTPRRTSRPLSADERQRIAHLLDARFPGR
jgi:hypothetical protein